MRKYFLYLIKKRFPIYLTAFIIFLLLFLVVNREDNMIYEVQNILYLHEGIVSVYVISLGLGLAITPIVEFSFKMKKITMDQAYSLPIKREKLYLTRYIIGFLEIVVPFTLSYFISLLVIFPWASAYCNFLGFFAYYGMLLVAGFVVYSILVFFFTKANNVIDGILCTLMATIILWPVVIMLEKMISPNGYINYSDSFVLFNYYSYTVNFTKMILFHDKINMDYEPLILFSILGVAASIGQYFMSLGFKSEDAGQRSESWFCYKIMLPVLLISTIFSCQNIIIAIIILLCTYLAYVLYKRSFKLDKKTWIIFACVMVLEITSFIIGGLF